MSAENDKSDYRVALSELEIGLILLRHAFERWMERCMAAAGVSDLSALDVLVLHTIPRRGAPKRLADLCFILDIEDTHLVTYSLKKRDRHKLLASDRRGSEKTVSLTAKREGGHSTIPENTRGAADWAGQEHRCG